MTVQTFEPRGSLEAVLAAALRKTLQALLKPVFSPRFSIAFQRRWLRWMSRLTLPARGVAFETGAVGGVPGEWVRPAHGSTGRTRRQRALPARRRLLRRLAGHPPRANRAAGATAPAWPCSRSTTGWRPSTRFPAALRRRRGRLPGAAGRAARWSSPATRPAAAWRWPPRWRCATAATPLPAALLLLLALGRPDAGAAAGKPPPGEAMLSVAWARRLRRALPGRQRRQPTRRLAAARRPARPAADADPGRHRRAAARRGTAPARRAAGRRRARALRDHGAALACLPDARRRPAQCRRSAGAGRRLRLRAREPRSRRRQPGEAVTEHEVVILGAGMSGLCMAIQLKRAGIARLRDPGEVGRPGRHLVGQPLPRRACRRAGAAVLVLASRPTRDWQRRFAAAPEIQAYMQQLRRQATACSPHLRFGTRVSAGRLRRSRRPLAASTTEAAGDQRCARASSSAAPAR